MKKGILCMCAGLILGAAAVAATAQDMTKEEMMKKIIELEKRLNEIESRGVAPAAASAAAPELEARVQKLEEGSAKVNASDYNVFWKDGLRIEAPDKTLQMKIGGRIFNDWYFPMGDSDVENAFRSADGDRPEQDWGTQFRMARLAMEALVFEHYELKAEYDFAGGSSGFKDVYLGVTDLPFGGIRVGHFKAPYSLEELTSDSFITFMERSLINTFSPARETGIMTYNTLFDDRMSYAVGFFKPSEDFADSMGGDDGFGNSFGDGEWETAARITGVPYTNEDGTQLVHLGASYVYRSFEEDDAPRFRTRPEVGYNEAQRLIDTGTLTGAEDMHTVGLEAAGVWGPASLQGEWTMADVERSDGFSDPSFMGYYVQASYFLTGEHRPYKASTGVFDRIRPKGNFLNGEGGMGAWELALRYSTLDLGDDDLEPGGELDDYTLGLNWYMTPNYRVMWNYIYADADERLGDFESLDESIFAMRIQVDF